MRKGFAKKTLSLLLALIMIMSSAVAGLSVLASALEWKYVAGTSYNPVTVYVQRDTMEFGKTYLIAVGDDTKVVNGANSNISITTVSANVAGTTQYFTSDDGSDISFVAQGDYVLDESNVYYTNNEYQWQKETDTTGYLFNAGTGLFLSTFSTYVAVMDPEKCEWTYDSSTNKLFVNIATRDRYLRLTETPSIVIGTANENNTCYFYEKMTVYKTVEGDGSLFKYVGQTDFAVDINSELDEQAILNTIAILHKEQGEEIPDEECAKLKITDEAVAFRWDQKVNMNVLGEYTGTVYVYGEPIQKLTVHVQDHSTVFNGIADPSTSRIENRFSLTSADDGKLASDKTVQYGSDEFGTFGSYATDEFSVALSALGQGYEMVETEETILTEKVHPDVIFILDASGSMRVYNVAGGEEITRGEATAIALNNAIKDLYEEDPDTRIGIVTYNNDVLEGVYLPLDKYTLPEGQTDYITWNGRNTATVEPATEPNISGVVNVVDPVVSVGSIAEGTTYYFYPEDGTLSKTDVDYQVMRYSVTSDGKIDQYNKGSVSPNNISSSLAYGKYIVDNVNGYAFYRRGNAFYMYKAEDFNAYLDSINAENYNTYQVKTVSGSKTVTGFESSSNQPGSYSRYGGTSRYNNPSSKTTIATANGVTYSGVWYGNQIYIYKTGHDLPVARMMSTPSSNYYTKVFTDENITITCNHSSSASVAEVTYTTNSYSTKTGTPTFNFEKTDYMMATNYLINSKGESVAPSVYTFIGNLGTYTQGGLQAAEDMYAAAGNKENRVPALVLISDGVPTIGNSDTQNPTTHFKEGVTDGYGLSTSPQTSNGLSNYGLWLIETAMKVKDNVNEMYKDSGNREGLFYSIGPGVDYIFGQTILNPSNENVEAAAAKTTNVGEDTESGVGVPSDLAKKIKAKYTDLDYVNYADWSYTGDVTSEELDRAFRKIVTSIVDIQRPVVEITTTEYGEDDITGAMTFTDNIGKGMEVSSDLVIRYGNNNYEPTNKTESTLEDGTKVTRFYYDYRVVEQSTRKAYNLKGLTVLLLTNPDGTQTVKWYIPGNLIPVIMYDAFDEIYIPVSPIRLVYKVGVEDEGLKGKFYTNSTVPDEIATSEFTPAVGNPYYYDNVVGDDNKVHSVLKDFPEENVRKTKNATETLTNSSETRMVDNGDNTANVISDLGNNGLIQVDLTNIYFTKMWDDGKDETKQRPDEITVQLYRNGYVYGEPMVIKEEDCTEVTDSRGNEGWYCIIKGLPFNKDFVYTIEEYEYGDYESIVKKVGDEITITNRLDRSELNYELYLVDKDGNPVDEKGNIVSFEDRILMSDTVTVNTYIHNTEVIDLDEIQKLLPKGYYIYNPNTSFTETYEGKNNENTKATVVDDETGTTKIAVPEGAQIGADGTVTGLGDFSEILVDFAICKIAINPDVIVVDYGKTILCSPLDNDSGNSVKLLGVGDIDGTTYSSSYTTENGVFRVEGNNVTFSPFSYMSSINRVKYYVSTVSDDPAYKQLSSTISVIPATSMYYEDNFGGSDENGGLYIEYSGDWYTINDRGNVISTFEANTDTSDRQDRGEVGQGHTPYGYDSSYDDCAHFSNGSAAIVEGTVSLNPITHRPQFDAVAEFEFTGTGFDIISKTDMQCGMITVYITDENGVSVNVPVINKGTQDIYQIPVISFDCETAPEFKDHPYGTYLVTINVNAPTAALNIDSSVFYLDAIRIYNPMGLSSADNKEFDEAHDAYNTDHEANEFVTSIRDKILDVGKLDETEQYGAVYVDTINNDYTTDGMLDDKDYEGEDEPEEGEEKPGRDTLDYRVLNQSKIKDFELIGPNEEIYLSPGYGVGFIVETTKKPASVQIDMKLPSPIRNGASLSVYTYGQTDFGKIKVNTATEMFYDITDYVVFTEENGVYRAVVVLENGLLSSDMSEVVSITNLKLTYDDDVIALDAADEDALILFDSAEDDNVAVTSLKASWNLYEDVFESVYTHRLASTPNYEIAEVEAEDTVASGKTVTATVKTSKYVEDLVIRDANGNVVKPVSIKSELDESKILTAEYKEAKTWTVSFKVYGVNGSTAGYTVESANGEGEVSAIEFGIHNPKAVSISVYANPKTSYKIGESFDSEGLALKVVYDDGSEKVIRSGFSTENVKFTKSGKYNVKVSYGGLETSVQVRAKYSALQIIAAIFGFGWLFK